MVDALAMAWREIMRASRPLVAVDCQQQGAPNEVPDQETLAMFQLPVPGLAGLVTESLCLPELRGCQCCS